MSPSSVRVVENKFLEVVWNDNKTTTIKLANLRISCPCAICEVDREQKSSTYIPIFSGEQLKITSIKVVGNYALNIIWADGHNTGMYDFIYLRRISESN